MEQQNHANEQTGLQNNQNQTKYEYIPTSHCTSCKQESQPEVHHQSGTGTYLCCLIWCFIAVVPGLIPFCCNRCKDTVYRCAICKHIVHKEYYEPCDCTKK